MYAIGDQVTYVGNVAEVHGMAGVVKGPSERGGSRVMVEFADLGVELDMSVSVLEKDEPEEGKMPKARKTTVTHPDGTVSTRNSSSMIYTYAVEQREDMWATAKLWRQQAFEKRAEKTRFVAAVRAGRIATRSESKFFDSVYLLGEGGEEFWIGHSDKVDPLGREVTPLDRKAAVRKWLASADAIAGKYDADADKAESGPQYTYSVVRWSQSHENATKGMREFEGRNFPISTFRVVPAEAAE